MTHQLPSGFRLFACVLMLFSSLFLSACMEEEKAPRVVPTLTEQNLREFMSVASHEYDQIIDKLEVAFNESKAAQDPDEFISYRNREWTWEYLELKEHYAAVLDKNRRFVASHQLQPLFDEYNGILEIGLDLKHALTENNARRERRGMESIKRGRINIAKVLLRVSKASG